jgi:phosphoribosylanthranilate isomerase
VTRVKVCGLTCEQDVRLAAGLGVWACGFVLSASPRQVAVGEARRLAAAAHDALTVAVVTTEPPGEIGNALAATGCQAVQLSAGSDGAGVDEVRAAAQARGLRPLVIAAADTPGAEHADLLLLDARRPGRYGGTGEHADWVAAARLAADRPLVLAGGLTPVSVGEAVAAVRPFAVDASSGLEASPGRKDATLLRAFVEAVAAADAQGEPR